MYKAHLNSPDTAPTPAPATAAAGAGAGAGEGAHDVKHEVQTWLRGQDPTFYRQGFEKWISRLDKCINREGDYVEK